MNKPKSGDRLEKAIKFYFRKSVTRVCNCQWKIDMINAWGRTHSLENIKHIIRWIEEPIEKQKLWYRHIPYLRFFIKVFVWLHL
jgi:hypothetical protein